MIGQSDDEDDDDNDETWPGNRDGKVADTETEDEKGNKKVGDENSDNVETVNTVNEAGSPVNENIGNIANSIESKSGEENSELTDCCKNKDKKEQTKNIDVDQRNAVMEETLNTPKAPDPEFQVQTDNVVDINSNNGTESYGEQMEVGCAEGYGCFDGTVTLFCHLKRSSSFNATSFSFAKSVYHKKIIAKYLKNKKQQQKTTKKTTKYKQQQQKTTTTNKLQLLFTTTIYTKKKQQQTNKHDFIPFQKHGYALY